MVTKEKEAELLTEIHRRVVMLCDALGKMAGPQRINFLLEELRDLSSDEVCDDLIKRPWEGALNALGISVCAMQKLANVARQRVGLPAVESWPWWELDDNKNASSNGRSHP